MTTKHLRDSHFRRFAVKPKLGPLHPVEEWRTSPREGCIRKLPLFGVHGIYQIVSLNGRHHYYSGGARVGGISNLKCHFLPSSPNTAQKNLAASNSRLTISISIVCNTPPLAHDFFEALLQDTFVKKALTQASERGITMYWETK